MTIKDATRKWIGEFNAIPQGMVKKLMNADIDEWQEVTTPAIGDKVYVYDESSSGEVTGRIKKAARRDKDCDKYRVKFSSPEKEIWVEGNALEVEYDSLLPMWGTMWSVNDPCDEYWLEDGDGIEALSDCGFRVYHNDEFGYFFGIDGAGYDFYGQHWIPLYKKRGLKWHEA